MIKVTGAEVYSYYVDPELILLGAKPVEFDSPYLWSVEECTEMAKRRARLLRSSRDVKIYTGFMDPRIEVQDAVYVENEARVVSGYTMSARPLRENPESDVRVNLRSGVDYNIVAPSDG